MTARRDILTGALAALALPALGIPGRAHAQPARPTKLVVGFPAGGGSDGATGRVGDGIATSRGRRRETPADSCSADRGCDAAGASVGAVVSFPGAAATRSAVEAAGWDWAAEAAG
jgi:hypothetical protein